MNAAQLADLKSCPFCGSAAERDPGWGGYVKCSDMQCILGGPNDADTHWISESAWNTRAELRALGGGWLPIESAPKDGTRVILDWDGKSINGFYLDNTWARIPYAGWRVEAMVVAPKGQPTRWQYFPNASSPAATVEG